MLQKEIAVFHTGTGLKKAGETTIKRRNHRAAKLANALCGPPDKISRFGTLNKRSQRVSSNAHAFESDDDFVDLSVPTKKPQHQHFKDLVREWKCNMMMISGTKVHI